MWNLFNLIITFAVVIFIIITMKENKFSLAFYRSFTLFWSVWLLIKAIILMFV